MPNKMHPGNVPLVGVPQPPPMITVQQPDGTRVQIPAVAVLLFSDGAMEQLAFVINQVLDRREKPTVGEALSEAIEP